MTLYAGSVGAFLIDHVNAPLRGRKVPWWAWHGVAFGRGNTLLPWHWLFVTGLHRLVSSEDSEHSSRL